MRTMVFGVGFLVSYLSRFMSLQPGDIISTGTLAGVGFGQKPPVYLHTGNVLRLGSRRHRRADANRCLIRLNRSVSVNGEEPLSTGPEQNTDTKFGVTSNIKIPGHYRSTVAGCSLSTLIKLTESIVFELNERLRLQGFDSRKDPTQKNARAEKSDTCRQAKLRF